MEPKPESVSPLHAASELTAEEKAVVDKLAGRPLAHDELFVIRTYRTHPAPEGEARQEAAKQLREAMDTIGQKLSDVPPKELERELDRALRDVRPGYRSVLE